MQIEAIVEKRIKCYMGWVDEVPGAFIKGRTIKDMQVNPKESVQLILESKVNSLPEPD